MTERLPGEGKIKTVTYKLVRGECFECGEPATKLLRFQLHNPRSNPASTAFGRNDISYCADEERYACDQCEKDIQWHPPIGMEWSSTSSDARFLLEWVIVNREVYDPDET